MTDQAPHRSHEYLKPILSFLAEIGIQLKESTISEETFLPGMRIRNGVLEYDPSRLLFPGDLLHEAGHIAVTPSATRHELNDNVDPQRMSGDEVAAVLWSYAAAHKCQIPAEVVFHHEGYKGESEWLRNNFSSGTFPGLPLIKWMGFVEKEEDFPVMKVWLRE